MQVTLRDLFASTALTALITRHPDANPRAQANLAYEYADAMLEVGHPEPEQHPEEDAPFEIKTVLSDPQPVENISDHLLPGDVLHLRNGLTRTFLEYGNDSIFAVEDEQPWQWDKIGFGLSDMDQWDITAVSRDGNPVWGQDGLT